MALAKRGVCTFVDKSLEMAKQGARIGVIVNTEDELVDMPAGNQKTNNTCTVGNMKKVSSL